VSALSGLAAALAYGWFCFAYVAFIASGALPSEARPGRRAPIRVVVDRLCFFVAVLVIPALILRLAFKVAPAGVGFVVGDVASWAPATLGLSAVGFSVGLFARKSPADMASYPQYLPQRWDVRAALLEIGSWTLYLAAYEFAFRGYLLAAILPLGPLAAVAVTTALYSVAHLPKSPKEAAGAILFGVIAAALALRYGSFLPALAIHLALALGNDLGALRAAKKAS